MPDLQFCNCGSFATMQALTASGLDWISHKIGGDSMDWNGAILIEFRYLEDIVLGARADGLTCEG